MRIAGEESSTFPLKAIVSINNPFDMGLAINLMRGNAYEKWLCKELVKSLLFGRGIPEEEEFINEMLEKNGVDREKLKKA